MKEISCYSTSKRNHCIIMKLHFLLITFAICIYSNQAQCKSLKNYHGNSIDHFKAQRKPFASPTANVIHDNQKRAKRQIPQPVIDFQEVINQAKYDCVRKLNMDARVLEKSLMYEQFPTEQEKCLTMCMLKKTKLMEKNNKISTKAIARIAGAMSENNPLVVSVAVATANNCNNSIRDVEPCEAAFQINKCINNELKLHKLKLYY